MSDYGEKLQDGNFRAIGVEKTCARYELSGLLRIRLRRKSKMLSRTFAGISSGRSDWEVATVFL